MTEKITKTFSLMADSIKNTKRFSLICLSTLFFIILSSQTIATEVNAGGYGGNKRIGKLVYSTLTNEQTFSLPSANLPASKVIRHDGNSICYLSNNDVEIINGENGNIAQFVCKDRDPYHNNLFWDANLGEENEGYSPENDALYAANVINKMFYDWYHLYLYQDTSTGIPKKIIVRLVLHSNLPDPYTPYIERNKIYIGKGDLTHFYPYTSLNILSYLLGFMFTQQYSELLNANSPQSTSIAGSFSCMTAMAIEYYLTGRNTWQVGADIAKNGEAIHYLDNPTKNCHGGRPGTDCDAAKLEQYDEKARNAKYYGAGLFNRVFYLLATSQNWNTHKAYDVFVEANRYYWSPDSNFISAACGVMRAARDLHEDMQAIKAAFSDINFDTDRCEIDSMRRRVRVTVSAQNSIAS